MTEIFNLKTFDKYKEDNCREVKKAEEGLPRALWETYSSFANSNGGVIILGVGERADGSWYTTGLKNADKLKRNFWDTIHNTKKVSINLLSDKNVVSYIHNGDIVLVIYVPRAKRDQKPVYINNDIFGGCFRRDWEGDYHCSKSEVKAMLRDATEESEDMKLLAELNTNIINTEAFKAYRNNHKSFRPEHIFNNLSDEEYMVRIGAAARADDNSLHPTAAGLLMFGDEYNIVREFPEYFLDYQEKLNNVSRWTDRLQSSSGDWSGNIFDFFFRVNNKLGKDIKKPFKLDGIKRIDDTPIHKAIREALVNCLVNTDYFLPCGVVVKKEDEGLIFENPGTIRTGKKQMLHGGISDPRNKTLMKMFNLIGIGERAGSGIPDIFQVWEDEGWEEPIVYEAYNPDRTKLLLKFTKKPTKQKEANKNKRTKTSEQKQANKNKRTKTSEQNKRTKTEQNYALIKDYLLQNGLSRTNDIAKAINLSPARTRALLKEMDGLIYFGNTNNRTYRLDDK